jgi:hypothetical protein
MKSTCYSLLLFCASTLIMVISGISFIHFSLGDLPSFELTIISALGLCLSLYIAYLNYKSLPKLPLISNNSKDI